MAEPTKHILVIRLSAMGDCAMVIPVVLRLIKAYPQVKITVVTKAFFKPIFETLPPEKVEVIEAHTNTNHKGLFGAVKLGNQLKKLDPDQVADLHNVLRSKIIRTNFLLSGTKEIAVIDKGRNEKCALVRKTNKIFKPLKTTPERYADVFKQLGYQINLSTQVQLTKPELSSKCYAHVGNSSKKWLGIAPFAAHKPKTYPLDLMEEIIAKIDKTNKYRLLMFGGGKKENDLLNNLASKYKNAVCLAGRLKFKEEIRVIANLDVMLSMDSGNGHLAAMFDIPVITLWGGTHPYAGFAPFNQPEENQLLPDLKKYPFLPTSIFGKTELEGYEDVMRSIQPERVLNRLKEILGNSA